MLIPKAIAKRKKLRYRNLRFLKTVFGHRKSARCIQRGKMA
jgi:hypothetical protein